MDGMQAAGCWRGGLWNHRQLCCFGGLSGTVRCGMVAHGQVLQQLLAGTEHSQHESDDVSADASTNNKFHST